MNKIRFWYNNARPSALPQSVMPALMAVCVAAANSEWHGFWCFDPDAFSLPLSLVAVVGIILAHLSVDLFDDYFDYRNAGIESRERLSRAGMRARLGKAEYLASGQATLRQTFQVAAGLGVAAIAMGIIVFVFRGWTIALVAGIGAVLGFFYSAPPLKLCYHGLGELLTGIMFGPLLMVGISIAACGFVPSGMGLISTAVGLLVINILYTHSIMDCAPDISVGKQTLATLLRRPVPQLAFSFVFNFVPFALVVIAVGMGYFNPWSLLVFLTLPMAIYLFRLMVIYCLEVQRSQPPRTFEPRWWMGSMQMWDKIKEAGIDWFMIRWYLSRNLITFFVIILSITAFLR
ncbi:MAG: prenyltransferase [Bacteroidales bacterium]|nr:prenyltransferase [Bacteroidales bacterium]